MILIEPMIFQHYQAEVWKPLVFENIKKNEYLISNYGNIYDLVNNKYISTHNHSAGYLSISLRTEDGNYKTFLLHRIIAENFVVLKSPDQTQVNHMDGNKKHNESDNLEWSTPKENTAHAYKTGLADCNIGEQSHLSKLTELQVRQICELLSKGYRYKEILYSMNMEQTPNNMDLIGNIYRRIAWVHISKDYKFPEYDDRFRVNSKETIEDICKYLESGLSNKEVYEKVFNRTLNSTRDDKVNYELIRMIRNKKVFKDISSKYNF